MEILDTPSADVCTEQDLLMQAVSLLRDLSGDELQGDEAAALATKIEAFAQGHAIVKLRKIPDNSLYGFRFGDPCIEARGCFVVHAKNTTDQDAGRIHVSGPNAGLCVELPPKALRELGAQCLSIADDIERHREGAQR